jgi:hypothetical protein
MKIRCQTSIDEGAWDWLVERQPSGSVYHTTAWARCVADAFGVRPLWLTAEDSGGGLAGGLPVAVVRSRFFGTKLSSFPCAQYCGPLVSSESGMHELFDALLRIRDRIGANTTEIRIRRPPIGTEVNALNNWAYFTHDVDLAPSENELLRSFHKSCIQRPLSKMGRSSLRVRAGCSETDIRRFYRLYTTMRKSKGLIPAPLRFFLSLHRTIMREDGGEILHAVHEGEIISSILVLYHGSTAIYEYGATLPAATGLHPNQLLLWEAMKRAKSRGCRIFNLGRTGRDNSGLLRYKQRWGADLIPLDHLSPGYSERRSSGGVDHTALATMMKTTVHLLPKPACVFIVELLYGQTL